MSVLDSKKFWPFVHCMQFAERLSALSYPAGREPTKTALSYPAGREPTKTGQ
jgi:hypothetical protein